MAKAIIILFLGLLSLAPSVYARGVYEAFDIVPGPVLFSPTTQDIDLTGKSFLEFKWARNENPTKVDHYEFRIYKGYGMLEAGNIFKQSFSYDDYPIKVPSSFFETGQIYTWSLKIVYLIGTKGDAAFSTFKIVNK